MTFKDYSERIGNLIGKDDLKAAIWELNQLLKDSPQLNEAIVQSARYNEVMKQIRTGSISFEEANLTKNKIRLGILNLLEEIETQAASNEMLHSEIEKALSTEGSISIRNSENVVARSDIQAGGDIIIGGSKNQNKAG